MMAFCSMLIMPSVASSRKMTFCDSDSAWAVSERMSRDRVFIRARSSFSSGSPCS